MRPRLPSIAARGVDTSRPPADRYRILGRIAVGGMAEIYLARMFTAIYGEREYVLKRLRPELQTDSEFVSMFYDEAQIASRLRHPNIAQIIELGEIDDSLFFTAEFVRGVNVRELHHRSLELGKGLPLNFSMRIACGVLHALEYAHNFADEEGQPRHIVHRDVSPQNILVTYGGEVKLVDFGVAKAEGRIHSTRIGLVKGKPLYMAPEQLFGDEIDGRADLFSLAEVLFEISLHRHPFFKEQGAMMEVLLGSQNLKPFLPEASFFPASDILLRALEQEPENRYKNAKEMRLAIEERVQERRLYSTSDQLGAYVQSLFKDRLELEERAREQNDDRLLIESVRVGSRGGMPQRVTSVFAPNGGEVEIPMEAPVELPEGGELVDLGSIDESDESLDTRPPGLAPRIDPTITAAIRSPARAGSTSIRIGKYSLERCVGRGAMAEVFRAHQHGDQGFDKVVAVKRVLPQLARNQRFVDLFMSEARLAGRLHHPNIVQVLDVGSFGEDHYFAMEYIDGWDLATILERCRVRKKQLSVKLACRIMSDVCAGLFAAHTTVDENSLPLMIVHRDVAPQNVLISKNGEVKLTDFGIARADDQAVVVAQTSIGEIRGKPAYMAPERLVPDTDTTQEDDRGYGGGSNVDARIDIFSAGAVLFEILALRPLFKRATPFETLMAVQRDVIPPISSIRTDAPRALDAVIERACSRFKNERYPTALALQVELERVLQAFDTPTTNSHLGAYLTGLFASTDSEDLQTDPHLSIAELGLGDEERTETQAYTGGRARLKRRE